MKSLNKSFKKIIKLLKASLTLDSSFKNRLNKILKISQQYNYDLKNDNYKLPDLSINLLKNSSMGGGSNKKRALLSL